MALIDCENGTTVTVMQGGLVPVDVKPDHLEHLLGLGLVEEAEFQGGIAATVTGDGVTDGEVSGRPAQAATKDEWVAYAVAQGVPADEAEATSKADLIARFKD